MTPKKWTYLHKAIQRIAGWELTKERFPQVEPK